MIAGGEAAGATAAPLDAATHAVVVQGLRKTYGRGRIRAIAGVSFDVARGEVFGLIGPDGAGKTSVLQVLAGVLKADAGTARVAGIDVIRDPEAVKPAIGYMPQGLGLNLYDALTVQENIEFFRDLRRVPLAAYRDNRAQLLRMTRLEPFVDRLAGKLSGGMRQKLALICTLIHLPDVLLLDEPTTGVDPISRRDFWTIIHTLVATRGVTVVLTTSYMDEAERCHRVSLMHRGTLIASGSPEHLTSAIGGRLFAVRGVHPDDALSALVTSAATQWAAIAGGEVRVLFRDGVGERERRAVLAGVPDASLEAGVATLEDVFVDHLTRDRPLPVASTFAGAVVGRHVPRAEETSRVTADRLTCRFGSFTAVDAVSLDIRPGEILGLLGPNGAGKTTLIKMLCGLERPTSGTGAVAGFDVRRGGPALRAHIGYMSQRFSLYRDQTVYENLRLAAGLHSIPRAARRSRIEAVLAGLGLDGLADRLPLALPLGYRQRLALGCAIIHEPGVLFLDEPTAGVDPLARRRFWDLVHLLAHQRGVTVLVSTHYMDEVVHCDRLGFMHEGRLIALGPPDDLTRGAEAVCGPMIAVYADDFARAFVVLRARFPDAMLYGRRIRWQSRTAREDLDQVRETLAKAGIVTRVTVEPLSMEDTFVSVLREAGLGRG